MIGEVVDSTRNRILTGTCRNGTDSPDEGVLARLKHMERQYRLTCLDCGLKFWVIPKLVKTSVFDGSVKGLKCPNGKCGAIVPWNERGQ